MAMILLVTNTKMLHYNFQITQRGWQACKYMCSMVALYGFIMLSFVGQVHAQGIDNPIGYDTLGDAIRAVVNAVITLSGIVAIGFLVYGGFLYITSGGDEQQIGRSKKAMGGGIIGLVLILLAYAIVRFILTGLGAS